MNEFKETFERFEFRFRSSYGTYITMRVNDEDTGNGCVTMDDVAEKIADFLSAAFGYRIEVTLDNGKRTSVSGE